MNTRRKLIGFGLVAADIVLALILVANILIAHAAKGRTYSDLAQIPHRHLGLVLGCPKLVSNGQLNFFFVERVKVAADLYRQGKVDYLLASGDNSNPNDDEPRDLKSALITEGVPAERIYVDYAGFSTLDSIVRAKEVFGQTEITVISQEFQDQRAIFIAKHLTLDAIGFNAPDLFSGRTLVRESLARVRAVLDVYLFRLRPRYEGEGWQPGMPLKVSLAVEKNLF